MIQLDGKTLRQIQLIQLEMLIEVDRICEKCNIKYNIFGGTLLGAIRHGGYIPWDDDADVAFLRSEYEKFRDVCKTELDTTRFYFQDQRRTKGYRWGYGKIRRKNTLFLREYQEHMQFSQGVFIDIFPIDGVPDNYFLRFFHNIYCTCIRKTLWSEVGRVADPNYIMRWGYSILAHIPIEIVIDAYHKLIKCSNKKRTKFVRILMFPTPNSVYGFPRKWYEESKKIEFENYLFTCIKEADQYLKFTYGDYMVMPHPNQRKTHPVSKIKL